MQTGQFTAARLHSVQEELIANRLGESDRQSDVNSRLILQYRLPAADMRTAAFVRQVRAVTPAAVQACAQHYVLVVDYLQEGVAQDGE
jgi:predicted Zn-dependent peptidase